MTRIDQVYTVEGHEPVMGDERFQGERASVCVSVCCVQPPTILFCILLLTQVRLCSIHRLGPRSTPDQ